MVGGRFLLRFDDICPTMNWAMWNEIELVLDQLEIRPLVAVVPDNKDPELCWDTPHSEFWDRARAWVAKGWTVAMHGYQHMYVSKAAGIMKLNSKSEFAGLSYLEQRKKLECSLSIFKSAGCDPKVWVAPAHSFDLETIRALRDLRIMIISDGLSRYPYVDRDCMFWVPQQLWRLRRVPAGIWTVCYHHNSWNATDIQRFKHDVHKYRKSITELKDVCALFSSRNRTIEDFLGPPILRYLIRSLALLPRSA